MVYFAFIWKYLISPNNDEGILYYIWTNYKKKIDLL